MDKVINEFRKYFKYFLIYMGVMLMIFFIISLLMEQYDSSVFLFVTGIVFFSIFYMKNRKIDFDNEYVYINEKKISFNEIRKIEKGNIILKSGAILKSGPFYSRKKFELLKNLFEKNELK